MMPGLAPADGLKTGLHGQRSDGAKHGFGIKIFTFSPSSAAAACPDSAVAAGIRPSNLCGAEVAVRSLGPFIDLA